MKKFLTILLVLGSTSSFANGLNCYKDAYTYIGGQKIPDNYERALSRDAIELCKSVYIKEN